MLEPPELRETGSDRRYFTPFADRPSSAEQSLDTRPTIDATERYLLRVFLRRYVSWCARRRRFAAMQGAARLFAEC